MVDDHPSVRMSLRFVIDGEPDLVVCGEADDAQPVLAMVEQLCPDIVIVDIALKESHGLDLIRDLHLRYPSMPIFVHSAHTEELYAPLCFHCGARGYMNKGEDVQTIIHAIRAVLDGGSVPERSHAQMVYRSARWIAILWICAIRSAASARANCRFLRCWGAASISRRSPTIWRWITKRWRCTASASGQAQVPSSQAVHRVAVLWNNAPVAMNELFSLMA